jgi:hypothetical protein
MIEPLSSRLIISLGLFSGICISAAWVTVRPFDTFGAICMGTATCALMLIVLRFDRAILQVGRRESDQADTIFKEG